MIVNRKELKGYRSKKKYLQNSDKYINFQSSPRWPTQNIQFDDQTQEIVLKNRVQNSKANIYLTNSTERSPLYSIESNINNKSRINKNYQKLQGFIRKNSVDQYDSYQKTNRLESSMQKYQKSTQKELVIQDCKIRKDKMSFDIDLSQKNLLQLKIILPNRIQFQQIYSLDLSSNKIRQILPTILIPFQFLRQLRLNKNKLQKISFPYNKMKIRHLQLNQNKLSNLNLEHLKNLQDISASHNRLIFITIPESVIKLNISNNMISNMYFIQKCQQIQMIDLSQNSIYDLNFNSLTLLDKMFITKRQPVRFQSLKYIDCSKNKICHLNGFMNIKYLQEFILECNELTLTKENINEILCLENLRILQMLENPLYDKHSINNCDDILRERLICLEIFNRKNINHYNQSSEEQIETKKQQSQQENQQFDSSEKPFRLFLQEQSRNQPKLKLKKNNQTKNQRQWIYTLGNYQQNQTQRQNSPLNSEILKSDSTKSLNKCQSTSKIIKNIKHKSLISSQKKLKQQEESISHNTNSNTKYFQANQSIFRLQQQNSFKQVKLAVQVMNFSSTCGKISSQKQSIANMIIKMSFIPPSPIRNNSTDCIVSRRIDIDQDEYLLFSQFFRQSDGIHYLKKMFKLQEQNNMFDFDSQEVDQLNQLKFFVHSEINSIYKIMATKNIMLSAAVRLFFQDHYMINIQSFLASVPDNFGCYHIAVRYPNKPRAAFSAHTSIPVCYLIQTKKI